MVAAHATGVQSWAPGFRSRGGRRRISSARARSTLWSSSTTISDGTADTWNPPRDKVAANAGRASGAVRRLARIVHQKRNVLLGGSQIFAEFRRSHDSAKGGIRTGATPKRVGLFHSRFIEPGCTPRAGSLVDLTRPKPAPSSGEGEGRGFRALLHSGDGGCRGHPVAAEQVEKGLRRLGGIALAVAQREERPARHGEGDERHRAGAQRLFDHTA